MTPQEFMDGAVVAQRGGEWGETMWTFDNEAADLSIDAQGATLADAQASALAAAGTILVT